MSFRHYFNCKVVINPQITAQIAITGKRKTQAATKIITPINPDSAAHAI